MTVGQCASCGIGLGPRARFCRGCGAAVEATEVGAGSPNVAEDTSRSCPSCAAPVSDGASFCLSCGERLGAGEAPAAPPPPPGPVESSPPRHAQSSPHPPSPPPRRGRGPLIAAGAFVACLALGGLVGGGAYLLSQDSEADDSGTGGPIWHGPGSGEGGGSDGSSSGGGEGGDRTDTPIHSGETSELLPGRYIQAGSFRSPEGAGREVDRLLGEGIDVEAVPADWADELLPGFQVLLVGPLATTGEEKQALRQLEDASVAGFGRDLTSSETVPGPEAAAGEWSGELERSHLRGGRRPSVYPVDFAIAADGESGTVEHVERDCSGSLTLIDDTGYSLAYAESIESGDCPRGGVWHLRPRTGEITAVWLHDDIHVMVDGDAAAVG